jgi:hypothetical protein
VTEMPWLSVSVYASVVLTLVGIFVITTHRSGFRLEDGLLDSLAITPATTLSHFHRHLTAGLFHTNYLHLAFNVGIFSVGFWFAQKGQHAATTVAAAYLVGIATVLALHLFVVIPLATAGSTYAVGALGRPLVGFSVIAYATLGMALNHVPSVVAWAVLLVVVVGEVLAAVFVTGPFISVYHLAGFGLGFYVRWAFLNLQQA